MKTLELIEKKFKFWLKIWLFMLIGGIVITIPLLICIFAIKNINPNTRIALTVLAIIFALIASGSNFVFYYPLRSYGFIILPYKELKEKNDSTMLSYLCLFNKTLISAARLLSDDYIKRLNNLNAQESNS
ncbi:hypothetical protein [Metamycoplasma neophronis]|uniref:Uncharacterized protein n=1 Tax=Metamycoplasma neophronis TaxID=872983 RepID=A0ABY2Z1S9_9BACT|nr:hypothetical protein [Metamycoplasma neophronis]TPR53720.1 hypothetical protein FJR74_02355 [Metamycoplasma neophronis]